MTTKVTVDAHSGWAVEVTAIDFNSDGTPSQHPNAPTVVPPGTVQEFYVHQSRELRIKELPPKT